MDWKKHLDKNSVQQIEKTVKIKVKLPHVNKKPLARKRIFVQTPFSHSTLNLERKKFTPQNHSFFSLHFLFRRDQNHYSNLTSKIMTMCEQILKKRQRPNTTQILLIVKTKRRPIIAPDISVRLLKTTLFSLHSSFCFATKPLKFFHVFHFRLQIHSKKIDFKKDFSNTPLRVVKRQRPNTIQIL